MRRRARPGGGRQVELQIEALGARGDGIGHRDGKPVFVPFVLPGERALVRLTGERSAGLRAEVVELLTESPARIGPPCPHFGPCGGCALQHYRYEDYLEFKRELVIDALRRAGFDDPPVAPIHAVPPYSRRRAVFAARRHGPRLALGFHGRQSDEVVNLESCLVVSGSVLSVANALRTALLACLGDRETGELTVLDTPTGADILLRSRREPNLRARQEFAEAAEARGIARISWAPPKGEAEPVVQRHRPQLEFADVSVTPPPGGFLQPTAEGEALLVDSVMSFLPNGAERVADLYCGCGTFTFPLSRRAQVLAAEGDEAALAALWEAARRADLAGRVMPEARDLARRPLDADELPVFDAVVFDPPRAGAKAQAEALAESQVPSVIAVSCNPNTFARDARALADGGYRLAEVRPLDQFLWSGHVELAALFRREGARA